LFQVCFYLTCYLLEKLKFGTESYEHDEATTQLNKSPISIYFVFIQFKSIIITTQRKDRSLKVIPIQPNKTRFQTISRAQKIFRLITTWYEHRRVKHRVIYLFIIQFLQVFHLSIYPFLILKLLNFSTRFKLAQSFL
jgi:hypothetical protein